MAIFAGLCIITRNFAKNQTITLRVMA